MTQFITTGVPAWLQPHKLDRGPPYTEYTVEKALDGVAGGQTLKRVCEEDPTMPSWRALLRHLHSDPKLLDRYYQAQAVGAEAEVEEHTEYMDNQGLDGSAPPEDAAWVREKTAWLKWKVAKRSERYREKREIDITATLDISEAMDRAQARLERARTLPGEYEVVDG